jgi:chorismate mutase
MKKIILVAGICFVGAVKTHAQAQDTFLQDKRVVIDSLDKALIHLLAARQQVVADIGRYKKAHHIPPLQAARFSQVLQKCVEQGVKEGLNAQYVTDIFNRIHEESLRVEEGK